MPANLTSYRDIDAVIDWIGTEHKETVGNEVKVVKPALIPTLAFPFAAPDVAGSLADVGGTAGGRGYGSDVTVTNDGTITVTGRVGQASAAKAGAAVKTGAATSANNIARQRARFPINPSSRACGLLLMRVCRPRKLRASNRPEHASRF